MAGERKPEAVVHGQGLALDIAHYNYTLRFRSCGLSRGAYGFALKTHKDAALDPTGWLSAPDTPEQRVTLSLHPPLRTQP